MATSSITNNPVSGPIVIAGGSGFLGISLATHLARAGRSVVLLSRRPPKMDGPWRHVTWDARTLGPWRRELDGAAGLVNLTGRSVDCIKTPDHQDEIFRSRVEATRLLGLAVRSIAAPPPVWVQMSTAHIYGDPPEVTCTEDSPFGFGLAPFVARAWEDEFRTSVLPAQRPVILRTSFVIGRDRGAGGGALCAAAAARPNGIGGQSRVGPARDELDPRDGHEPAVRAGIDRSGHAGPLHRVVAQSGLAARIHARAAPRRRHAHRPAGVRLDGSPGRRRCCCTPTRNLRSTDGTWSRGGCATSNSNFNSHGLPLRSAIF